MPALNKQTLINLLIDSPLREPIKINLIDIINNTADADLAKVYPTIVKELEIFQKATDRRLKLAEETIAKLNEGSTPTEPTTTPTSEPPVTPPPVSTLPPLPPLPPLPTPPQPSPEPAPLAVPPLDLPPLPNLPTPPTPAPAPVEPAPAPTPKADDADEAALAEIQKELDALKSGAVADATPPQS